jgi:hypothetical protein
MKKKLSIIFNFLGINLIQFLTNIRGIRWYLRDLRLVKKNLKENKDFKISSLYPCLMDKSDNAGINSGHYFHQDLLVAQQIFLDSPIKHIDVGSRIDGFVAHVASFRKIDIIDIRDLSSEQKNIGFLKLNVCEPLKPEFNEITDSISCLHAIEHFGLGRYGDPIDVDAHLKALDNFKSMLKPKGKFYFSTPIGPQRIEFNAHRVFSVKYLLEKFKNNFSVEDFYYVNDKGNLIHPKIFESPEIENNFGCNYGCGIFFLKKI